MATKRKTATETTAPVEKVAATRAPSVDVYLEACGQQISVKALTKAVKDVVGKAKKCQVYVKPEDGKAYIVADGNTMSIEL
ncbi:MAG: hypothetical protein IKV30_02845 [Clostridia bacterium]|nr:hypothetical protein [Clostridia bacterium]